MTARRLGTPVDAAVLAVLRGQAWHGRVAVSHREIAEVLGVCRRTVLRSVARLERDGIITRVSARPGEPVVYALRSEVDE